MASLNKVLLIGNLTRDPELRYLTGGNSAVCEFGIAINRRFMQNGGQEKEETCFLEIVVWGRGGSQTVYTVFLNGRRDDNGGGLPDGLPPEDDGYQSAPRAPRQQGGYPQQGGGYPQQNRAPQGQPYRRQQFDEPSYNPAPNMQPRQGMPDSGPDPLENVDDIPF